jgi:hypothetical protein
MTVDYLQMLLATAQDMLATTTTLPRGASRDDAIQMIREYVSNIALLMNAIEITLNAKAPRRASD